MVRTQPTTENLSFSSCLYVKAIRPDQVKGLFAYILQSGQHGIITRNSTFCEVLFYGDPMKSFHAKTDNERFTAAVSRCSQNLKFENFTSSFRSRPQRNVFGLRTARLPALFQPITSFICGFVFCPCWRRFLISPSFDVQSSATSLSPAKFSI